MAKEKKVKKKSDASLQVLEKRKHPRFLLSREQFRETKSGKTYPVYDLSLTGLSIKIDEKLWKPGMPVQGILNLHPDSIEISPKLIDYYGDRAALKLESLSTYSRSILLKSLSPKRLGSSLQVVKEKLPIADYWYHGFCNTDLLIKFKNSDKSNSKIERELEKVELFFSNFYWAWTSSKGSSVTGSFYSFGVEKREEVFLGSEEPVTIESIELILDKDIDEEKVKWAKAIFEAASIIDAKIKELILKMF
jgi:hypothetical protein